MRTTWVVICTSPTVDTSTVVGPFYSPRTALSAYEELTYKGWNTEMSACLPLADADSVNDWESA